MSRRGGCDVAVVGAGMVGAALALALARSDFAVTLIETKPPAPWRAADELDLRVVALAPSAAELLREVEAWSAIRAARACAYRCMRVWDAAAPGELAFDAADSGEPALGWIVENRLVAHALWQACEREPRIALRCPARVTGSTTVGSTPDGSRRVLEFDDGGTLAAQLVVAADGAESPLRALAGIAVQERDYAQRAVVAHVATQRPHEATAWQRFLPRATLAFLPLADGRSSIVWSAPAADAARLLALDDAAFCAELGAAFDFRLGRVTATTPRAAFPLRLRLADTYLAPRLALIGDAAHVVHPLAGQGVNLGLRDVTELRDALVGARARGADYAATPALRRYERRRRSDNALSAHAFDAIQRTFGSASPALAAVRGTALAALDRLGPIKDLFARHAAGR